jgi:predicted phage replisome organizer|nr:MAG TPA: replisome organizer protein [Caudoviricetes sp.]
MAKRYYWLKLPKDFFEDKAIKRLRQIAGGDTYTIIYLKMLLKSMEDDGKLFYEGIEDTICDEIALDINESADDVQVTISYLEKKGLLIVTDSEVELTRLTEMVGSESAVTERVRKHRETQKLLQGNTIETKCNTEKEKEIEKSREDIDTDKKKKKKSAKADLDGMIDSFTENEELKDALKAFLDMRKSIKKPIQTEYAFKLALNKLNKLSDRDSDRIEIVNQSVEHNWQTFYALQNSYRTNEVEMPDYMKKQEKGDIVSTPVNEETLAKALELQRQFKEK